MEEWKKDLLMIFAKDRVVFRKKTTPYTIKAFIQAQISKALTQQLEKILKWITEDGHNKWINGQGVYVINDQGLDNLKKYLEANSQKGVE